MPFLTTYLLADLAILGFMLILWLATRRLKQLFLFVS
jgi:hypothetical protein